MLTRDELLFLLAILDLGCLAVLAFNYLYYDPYSAFNPGEMRSVRWKRQKKVIAIFFVSMMSTSIAWLS